jgi:alpha-2-macroglobulin
MIRFLVFLCFLFFRFSIFASSSFYLTVERTYETKEESFVRLDYAQTSDLLKIRILKPSSEDEFLKDQFQILRTYEQAESVLNAAHIVARGANKISNPFVQARRMLTKNFRLDSGNSLRNPMPKSNTIPLVKVPTMITIAPPKGFEIVRQLNVNKKQSEQETTYTNTPEDYDSYFVSEYNQSNISLGKLEAGLYLIQAVQGRNEAQALLQVSDVVLQIHQAKDSILARLFTPEGNVISNSEVQYRAADQSWKSFPQKTNDKGESLCEAKRGCEQLSRSLVRARSTNRSWVYAETDFLPSQESAKNAFVFTDRPMYKSGDSVHFKSILREKTDGGWKAFS